jgi:hypothetical protein
MIPVAVSYVILFAIIALILVIGFDDDDPRFP